MGISVHQVIVATSRAFNLSTQIIVGNRRSANIAGCRQLAYWIANDLCGDKSVSEIARVFHKDHTTIISGVTKMERLLETSEHWRTHHAAVIDQLQTVARSNSEAARA